MQSFPTRSNLKVVSEVWHSTQRKITVGTNQRETIFFMYFGQVVHQPGFGAMAANTVVTYRLAVHIGMAGCAVVGQPDRQRPGWYDKVCNRPGHGHPLGHIRSCHDQIEGCDNQWSIRKDCGIARNPSSIGFHVATGPSLEYNQKARSVK